ncbi:MAG: hypothetical protein ACF8R7_12095 [Phycisphaerales bacterium JB039]
MLRMPRQIAVSVAVVCGLVAFTWTLLANIPPPSPAAPAARTRAPASPDHPDRLLDWLAQGNGERDFVAWRSAGEIHLWRGDLEMARDAWRRAAQIASAEGDERPSLNEQFTLAWALVRLEDPEAPAAVEEALRRLDGLDEDGFERYQPPIYRSLLLRLVGDEAAAAAEIDLARARFAAAGEAESAETLYWLARIEAGSGDLEGALAALERAAETGQIINRIGRARWSFEFGALRDDERFQQAIRRLVRNGRFREG